MDSSQQYGRRPDDEKVLANFSEATRSPRRVSTSRNAVDGGDYQFSSRCSCCYQGICRYNKTEVVNDIVQDTANKARGGTDNNDNNKLNFDVNSSFQEDDGSIDVEYGDVQDVGTGKYVVGGRIIRRGNDGPKFVDTSTPTLIDELDIYEDEEEEQEMVKLEYERIRRNAAAPIGTKPNPTRFPHFSMNDSDAVRRTPGAQMYRSNYDYQGSEYSLRSNSFDRESMRWAPGASKMHASTVTSVAAQQSQDLDNVSVSIPASASVGDGKDTTGLGFGLTLSSPINTDTASKKDSHVQQKSRNDLTSSWSMEKNKQQQQLTHHQMERERGAYSPNTLRLTADLGNLLLEDDEQSDESQMISQFSFRPGTRSTEGFNTNSNSNRIIRRDQEEDNKTTNESWTTPFTVNVDQHQHTARVPRNASGRGRKSRLERAGRSRGGLDRASSSLPSSFIPHHQPNQNQQRLGGNNFLPQAQQPTSLRNNQSLFLGGNNYGGRNISNLTPAYDMAPPDLSYVDGIVVGRGSSSPSVDYIQQQGHPAINAPILNFGGAFSPPIKVTGVPALPFNQQHRSLSHPSVTGSFFESSAQGNSSFDTSVPFSFPTGTPSFGGNFSNTGQHRLPTQPPSFQPTPSFGHHPPVQTLHPHFGSQHPQNLMFANSNQPPPSQIPNLNFQQHHTAGYQANAPPNILHQHNTLASSNFASNINMPHDPPAQQAPQFVTAPQPWPPSMPMQYDRIGSPNLEHYDQLSTYSSHNRWQIQQQQQQQQYRMHSPHQQIARESPSFIIAPSTQTWNQEKEGAYTDGMPVNTFNPLQRKSPVSPAVGRPPSRGKNQRRSSSRKWSNKNLQRNANNIINGNDKGSQRTETASTVGRPSSASSNASGKKTSCSSKSGKKKHPTKDRSTPTQVERSLNTPVEEISGQSKSVPAEAGVLADAKRAELSESPATRSAFKDFYRKLRAEERISFHNAEKYAMTSLSDGTLPEPIHWRIYLELADLAKRSNRFEEARNLYQKVYKLQPYASQGWLEFSKLEEECGNMNACAKILFTGLEYCEYSENLLIRAIKHEEKRGNICRARELLSRLKHVGIEKVWRTVLEGAMLEARAGNDVMARRVLKYLMHHVPWYGPLYLEAYKLEKDLGRSKGALAVVERGLAAIPRYGPLWFGAFRLCEELDLEDRSYRLPQSMAMIDRATLSISKELVWKVHLEAAQMLERSSTENLSSTSDPTFLQAMEMSRKRFALTMISCPPNLRWKVWLAAGRMEVAAGNSDIARRIFLRAHRVVPDKGRAVALLECARLEEFVGDVELAKAILCRSRNVGGSDWKVWLESVMLAIRNGNYTKAIALSQKALQQHSGTGRLWASLIQLRHLADVEEAQFQSLALALNAVPKSGEVWCEGARIHLNPFSRTFDIHRANRHLYFATKFTPQYGDGFLETLRLLILDQLLLPISSLIWEESKDQLIDEIEESNWEKSLIKYIYKILIELDSIRDHFTTGKNRRSEETPSGSALLGKYSEQVILERLHSENSQGLIDISRLELQCANADPNYGPVWFHCRSGPTETARNVLARAVNLILDEVKIYANLYTVAFVRRFAVISRFKLKGGQRSKDESAASWEKRIDGELLSAPSLKTIIDISTSNTNAGVELLESSIPPSNFIAGIVELSQHHPIKNLTLSERRKVLFGADSLFS